MLKWLLCPGPVVSETDGNVHWIGAQKLARLYGVHMRECAIRPNRREGLGWKQPSELTELHPRYNGDYTLPEKGDDQ